MATFTSTSTRITISGTYKAFTGDSGSTTTVVQYASGDAPATGDAGRFLLWKVDASATGTWQVRYIESATATTVTVTDGGFGSAPPVGAAFVISTNLDDIDAAYADTIVRSQGRSFQIRDRDFELSGGAFLADVNASISSVGTSASSFAGTYPIANGCVLQLGRLIGGEASDSTETIGGCQLLMDVLSNNTLMFTTAASAAALGPVLNLYGCLVESFGTGGLMFIRSPGPMRIIGCVMDGPMGGRLYSDASELVDTRFSGNGSGAVAWSLGAAFTRPIANAFFFQNNTAIKAFQGFTGSFSDCTFSATNTQIIDSSGAFSALLFEFVDCTTFLDAAISNNRGQFEQAKSINYVVADASGTGLNNVKVAVYDTDGDIQGSLQTSLSGTVPAINARFFRKDHGAAAVDKSPFDIRIRKYGYTYLGFQSAVSEPIKQEIRLADNLDIVLSRSDATALTGISIDFATNTLTITEDHNTQNLYDYYQRQLEYDAKLAFPESWVRAADLFNMDDWDVIVDGCTYTGDMTTTGTITLANGAIVAGTRTDSGGTRTITTLTLTGLQTNTEVRVYGAGTTTELAGVENSSTTFTTTLEASSVDIVVHALGYEYQKIAGADTSADLTLPIQQRFDRNYRNP